MGQKLSLELLCLTGKIRNMKNKKSVIAIIIIGLIPILILAGWWFIVPRYPIMAVDWLFPEKHDLRFFLVGDTGTGDEKQNKVAQAMEERCRDSSPDGIILLGDNFHGPSSKPDWEKNVFNPYGSRCLSKLPIFAATGNHDYEFDIKSQIAMTDKNERWIMPHRFFNLNFGALLKIIVIDTHVFDKCWNSKYCTQDFLKKSLEDQSSRWNIVIGHQPIAQSTKQTRLGSMYQNWFRGRILPMLCNKIDAYISGHSHVLEYSVLPECNLNLFIVGGGGAGLHNLKDQRDDNVKFLERKHGFLEIEVEEDEIEWKFISDENELLYKVETKKPSKARGWYDNKKVHRLGVTNL